ncbi:hypothetical protein [Nocardioides albus]|uniref:Uncharacterized protein YaaQ n=1 Tax=Nocardioides albus TaxID=1841 RepID=A0A7W5F9W8_9ACTN|nr:hypothetical protein [Nocardioides albus]MBB3090506.1 uncharacterized protein YaaQ [Nocardioides albus]
MFNNADDALASVDRLVAQAQQKAEQAQRYADNVANLKVTGRSRAGAEVTLSNTGALVNIELLSGLNNASLDQIRSAVLEANANAQGQLSQRVAELAADSFGQGSETAGEFTRQYAEMFPPPSDEKSTRGGWQ